MLPSLSYTVTRRQIIIGISLNHAVAVYTNLLRETDSDLTEAGTPLSQAS